MLKLLIWGPHSEGKAAPHVSAGSGLGIISKGGDEDKAESNLGEPQRSSSAAGREGTRERKAVEKTHPRAKGAVIPYPV